MDAYTEQRNAYFGRTFPDTSYTTYQRAMCAARTRQRTNGKLWWVTIFPIDPGQRLAHIYYPSTARTMWWLSTTTVTFGKSITLQTREPKRSSANLKPTAHDMVSQIQSFLVMTRSTLTMLSPDYVNHGTPHTWQVARTTANPTGKPSPRSEDLQTNHEKVCCLWQWSIPSHPRSP